MRKRLIKAVKVASSNYNTVQKLKSTEQPTKIVKLTTFSHKTIKVL